MIPERRIASRIAEALLRFFLVELRAEEIELRVGESGGKIEFLAQGTCASLHEERLAAALSSLSLPRRRDMEGYYGALSADPEQCADLAIVGMMVDESQVDYRAEERRVRILLRRNVA